MLALASDIEHTPICCTDISDDTSYIRARLAMRAQLSSFYTDRTYGRLVLKR